MRMVSTPRIEPAVLEKGKDDETPTKIVQKAVKGRLETEVAEDGSAKDRIEAPGSIAKHDEVKDDPRPDAVKPPRPVDPATEADDTAPSTAPVSPQKAAQPSPVVPLKTTAPKAMQPASKGLSLIHI